MGSPGCFRRDDAAAFPHIARQHSHDGGFFADTAIKVNFIVNVGYGNPAGHFARLPRLGLARCSFWHSRVHRLRKGATIITCDRSRAAPLGRLAGVDSILTEVHNRQQAIPQCPHQSVSREVSKLLRQGKIYCTECIRCEIANKIYTRIYLFQYFIMER